MNRENLLFYQFIESSNAHSGGDLLVLLHGLGLDSTTWSSLIPHLRDNYHLLLVDLRGHGRSVRGHMPITWESMLEDLTSILQPFQDYRLHLVGHALGGYLALQYAARYPTVIHSVALVSTICIFSGSWVDILVQHRKNATKEGLDQLSKQIVPHLCHPPTEEKLSLLYRAFSRVDLTTYFELLQLMKQADWESILRMIQCPVLQLAGERDSIYPPHLIGLGIGYLKHARFLVVPHSSNVIQLDQPELFADWLQAFLHEKMEQVNQEHPVAREAFIDHFHSEVNKSIASIVHTLHTTKECVVQLVDRFRVRINGRDVLEGWNQRNAKSLFAYLLIHQTATREELCDLFWPEVEISKARRSLRVSLNHLKKLIPKNYIIVDNEHIHLQGSIHCDYFHLKEKLTRIRQEQEWNERVSQIEDVIRIFPHSLFPGFYDSWILPIRKQIEAELAELCIWASKELTKQNQRKRSKPFQDYLQRIASKI